MRPAVAAVLADSALTARLVPLVATTAHEAGLCPDGCGRLHGPGRRYHPDCARRRRLASWRRYQARRRGRMVIAA